MLVLLSGSTCCPPVAPGSPILKGNFSKKRQIISSCSFLHKSYDVYGSTWLKYSSPNLLIGPEKWNILIDQGLSLTFTPAATCEINSFLNTWTVGDASRKWGTVDRRVNESWQTKVTDAPNTFASFTIGIRASNLICEAQFKMKILGSFFKKQ